MGHPIGGGSCRSFGLQRYLLEDEPRDVAPKPPLYCFDVTISDGVCQEKCYLDPSLNSLVYKNILKVGIEVRISRVSCIYNEKRIGQGILCINNVLCGELLESLYKLPSEIVRTERSPKDL